MKIEEGLRKFLVQLEANGRSGHTSAQYFRHVRLLARTFREHRLEEVGHAELARFLASPRATRRPDGALKKATSMNALRTSLRCFFGYLHAAGYLKSNPARLIRRAICSGPLPRALSEGEVARLLAALAACEGWRAERNHLLVVVMLRTGIRLGSAMALRVEDVDVERGELVLRRMKGARKDVVEVERDLVRRLETFTAGRRSGPLWLGQGGAALSARHVQRTLATAAQRAGIRRPVRPHDLRHTLATRLYEETHDLLLVQAALRHRSIASTVVYAGSRPGRI